MPKGKTLWEMLVDRFKGPVEQRYYNPLHAKVGGSMTIEEPDLKDYNFFVKEIREYKRTIDGRDFVFVDYVLLARPLGQEDVRVRLRLVPVDEPDAAGGMTHHALVLRLYDEFAYDEGFYKTVTDTTGKFEVSENDQVTEEYWRVNDVLDAYAAQVTILKDTNSDGTVSDDEIETRQLEYWDYWREIKDEAGQPLRQYLFAEIDQSDGWTQLWRGQEADAQRVLVF